MTVTPSQESLRLVRADEADGLSASRASDEESGHSALPSSSDGAAVTWVVPRFYVPRQFFLLWDFFIG